MEEWMDKIQSEGTNFSNDTSLRMPTRPQAIRRSSRPPSTAYEDLGATIWSSTKQPKPMTKPKTYGRASKSRSTTRVISPTFDSGDEIDMLSSRDSTPFDFRPPHTVAKSSRAKGKEIGNHGVLIGDAVHPYHPSFTPNKAPPKSKLPSFKKIRPEANTVVGRALKTITTTSEDSNSGSGPGPSATGSRLAHRVASKEVSGADHLPKENSQNATSQSSQSSSRSLLPDAISTRSKVPLHDKSTNKRIYLPLSRPTTDVSSDVKGASPVPKPSPPKPRPIRRPKPIPSKIAAAEKESSSTVTPSHLRHAPVPAMAEGEPMRKLPAAFPGGNLSPLRSQFAAKADGEPKGGATKTFPIPSPLSSEKGRYSSPNPEPSRAQRRSNTLRKPAPFPLGNPEADPSKTKARSGSSEVKRNSKRVVISDDDDSSTAAPRPFPMSAQVLESIGPALPYPGREFDLAAMDMDIDNFEEEESLSLSSSIDPKTLCPYCDETLPMHSSPLLVKMLSMALTRSYPDPRLSNPLGRKAPFTVFVSLCQRHRFEVAEMPMAKQKGWPGPGQIDWSGLRGRIEKMKDRLEKLILDEDREVGDNDEGSDQEEEDLYTTKGPKALSIFWREIKKEIKKKGSRAVVGVSGQFADFDKAQPGYYGELGSVIINQTLYTLFPPATIPPKAVAPLTPAEFIQRILVPEVAVALIREDMDVSKRLALRTLRDSVRYGVAMFPADESGEGDNGSEGEGEEIVKERARTRRKELDEEERIEKENLARKVKERKGKGRERGKRKRVMKSDRQTDIAEMSEASDGPGSSQKTDWGEVTANAVEGAVLSDTNRRSRRRATQDPRQFDVETNDIIAAAGSDSSAGATAMKKKGKRKGQHEDIEVLSSREQLPTDAITPRPKPEQDVLDFDSDDETPRPSKVRETEAVKIQKSSMVSMRTKLKAAKDSVVPSHDDDWQYNMRTTGSEFEIDVDIDPSDVSNANGLLGSTAQQQHHHWLLSDSSQASDD